MDCVCRLVAAPLDEPHGGAFCRGECQHPRAELAQGLHGLFGLFPFDALKGGPPPMHPHVAVILHALVYLRSHLTEMTDPPSNEDNKEPACDPADASPQKARPDPDVAPLAI